MPERPEGQPIHESDQTEKWAFPYVPRDKQEDPDRIWSESYGSPDKETRIRTFYQDSKYRLSWMYGVDNITPIEAARLREIVVEVLNQHEDEADQKKRGEITGIHEFDVEPEAADRWFDRLYGIDVSELPHAQQFWDDTADRVYTFDYHKWLEPRVSNESRLTKNERYERAEEKATAEAAKKAMELRGQGHKIRGPYNVLTDASKEYIRRKREQAHNP